MSDEGFGPGARRMARFLMMPHSPVGTLAHLAACSAVGAVLRERGHDVQFTHGGSNAALLDDAGFTWHLVRESHGPMTQDWFRDAADLEGMLASQLEVIKEFKPHVCVTSAGIGRLAAEVSRDTTRHLAMHHNLVQSNYGRRALRAWKVRYDLRRPRRLVRDIYTRVKPRSADLKAVSAPCPRFVRRTDCRLWAPPPGPRASPTSSPARLLPSSTLRRACRRTGDTRDRSATRRPGPGSPWPWTPGARART